MPIEKEKLADILASKPGRTTGLTSLVGLDEERWREGSYYNLPDAHAHLPLIDMDLDRLNLSREEQLSLIRKEIREKTEMNSGVVLLSSPSRFHFIGIGRLLTDTQLVKFLGGCLNMRGPGYVQIVDSKWAGHGLTPMNHLVGGNGFGAGWSIYDLDTIFATLRITTSEKKPHLPMVVDIL